jgi:hypothetical protein
MFKNKGVKTIEKQVVVEPKGANPSVHIVDVNMAITRKKCKHHNRKPLNKIRFTQTKTNSILPQIGKSEYD